MQPRMKDGVIYIRESDPATEVTLTPTVPVSCAPCTMTLSFTSSIGLELSDCSVTFSGIDGQPHAGQAVSIRAIETPSSFSRVARIVFSPVYTTVPGSPWDGYKPHHCPVCSHSDYVY